MTSRAASVRVPARPGPDVDLARLRAVAFGAAYRMLGSVTEAEDVAQDALLRVAPEGFLPADVRNPEAFTTTVATRIALDVLRSARVRRESYVGEWIPEPLVGDAVAPVAGRDAARHAELADDLSTAFLVLLETLTPSERAAFLLHDVLGYPHRQSARVIGTTETAARQLASRARRRVARARDGADVPAGPAEGAKGDPHAAELVARFIAATQEGDLEALLTLLADDVTLAGDGGGNVPAGMAISKPIWGREAVARLLLGYTRRSAPAFLEAATVNGRPGIMVRADDALGGGIVGTYAVETDGGRITAVRGVINPDKLRHLGRLADLEAMARAIKDAARRRRSSPAPRA